MLRSGKSLRLPKMDANKQFGKLNQPIAHSSTNVQVQTKIAREREQNGKVISIREATIIAGTAIGEAEYPYDADDPVPIADDASAKQKSDHSQKGREYIQVMLAPYGWSKIKAQLSWTYLVKEFRPLTIRSWTRPMETEWHDLL